MNINTTQNNSPSFNASLRLRGNVRGITSEQTDYLKKVVNEIGTLPFDKIDIFANVPKHPEYSNTYGLIDVGAYINKTLRATNVAFVEKDVYSGVVRALKFILEKVYNNEIIRQFYQNSDPDKYKNLQQFISENQIELKSTIRPINITSKKLTIDGNIDPLSNENIKKLAAIADNVAINPHDHFYIYVRQGTNKKNYLINIAGYVNGDLKSTHDDYPEGINPYSGIRRGLIFMIEKLLGRQIQYSALQKLSPSQREELNKFLQQEKINLII